MKFDNIKDMSIEQAKSVIRCAFMYDDETIETAFAKIEALAPMESDVTERSGMEHMLKLKDIAKEELRKKQAQDIVKLSKTGALVSAIHLNKAEEFLADVNGQQNVDTYDGPDEIKDSATAEKNFDSLKAALDALEKETDENGNPKWMSIVKEYTDKFDFVDSQGKVVDEESRRKALETAWRATKTNILVAHTLDWEWMKKFNAKDIDRNVLLKDEVEDYYAFTLAKAYDAKSVREPKGKEWEVGSEEYLNYMREVTEKSFKSLKKLLSDSKSKIKINMDRIVDSAANAYSEIDSLANHLSLKGFKTSLVNKVKNYRNEFNDWMDANHPNLWKKAKAIAVGFKANKCQIISNTIATVAYTGATIASIATANPALWAGSTKAYAFYMAGGSAVFPFFQKRHIEREQARKMGGDVAKWNGWKGLQNAAKATFSNSRDTLGYCAKVAFGVGAAWFTCAIADSTLASLGIQKGAGKAVNAAKFVVASRGARLASSLVRSASSVMAQAATYATDGVKYFFKPNEINKAYYEQSKQGLKWGAGIAGAGMALQLVSYEFMTGSNGNVQEQPVVKSGGGKLIQNPVAPKLAEKVDSLSNPTEKADSLSNSTVVKTEIQVESGNGSGTSAVVYPPVWDEKCGISQKHFEEIYGKADANGNWVPGKITGILARQNKAFDDWNAAHPDDLRTIEVKSPEDTYKNMMQNLVNARKNNSKLFGDMTNDQVMYKYIKLVEYSERAKSGPVVDGVRTLITVTDKNGMPMYASNQEEMQAMFQILRCGKKVDISTEALNANLDRIDLKSGAGIGKEFAVNQTGNSFWGYGEGCEKGVSMWKRGFNAIKKVFSKDATVKSVQTSDLKQDDSTVKSVSDLTQIDANVRSVRLSDLEQVDGEARAVYESSDVLLGKGTSNKFDNDLTDPMAQKIKKVGSSVELKGTYRKIDNACWINGNPKDGGRY